MIIVNGCPKSGTHAAMAWLSRMGLKRQPGVLYSKDSELQITGGSKLDLDFLRSIPDNVFMQGHVHSRHDLSGFCVLTIFRDPRNVITSYCRHRWQHDNVPFSIAQALTDFWGQPFATAYSCYLGWKAPGRSIVIRYEDLAPQHIGEGEEIYSGNRPAWDQWIGNTRTGDPSDYEKLWRRADYVAWGLAGGDELVTIAGYG